MPGKHVIFLGAGASASSGFPMAYHLKLLMTSAHHRHARCQELFQAAFPEEGAEFIREIDRAIVPFSEASFSSVDEFCRLATGTTFNEFIPQLKQLMRLVLSIDNPTEKLDSDYGFFVNKLFKNDGYNLRDDIAVLTFNYDTHLDSLLHGAVNWRYRIRTGNNEPHAPIEVRDAVTSGFASHGAQTWKDQPGFCLLKLHGSLAYPAGQADVISWRDLYDGTYRHRAIRLSNPSFHVPCIFPWEIIRNGEFRSTEEFCLKHQPKDCPADVYTVFRDTWERARREVTNASKISFVGLSMHPFLEDGLKFLFADRTYPPDRMVSANSGNKGFTRAREAFRDPLSPASRVARFFATRFRHWHTSERNEKPYQGEILMDVRESFREFVDRDI